MAAAAPITNAPPTMLPNPAVGAPPSELVVLTALGCALADDGAIVFALPTVEERTMVEFNAVDVAEANAVEDVFNAVVMLSTSEDEDEDEDEYEDVDENEVEVVLAEMEIEVVDELVVLAGTDEEVDVVAAATTDETIASSAVTMDAKKLLSAEGIAAIALLIAESSAALLGPPWASTLNAFPVAVARYPTTELHAGCVVTEARYAACAELMARVSCGDRLVGKENWALDKVAQSSATAVDFVSIIV